MRPLGWLIRPGTLDEPALGCGLEGLIELLADPNLRKSGDTIPIIGVHQGRPVAAPAVAGYNTLMVALGTIRRRTLRPPARAAAGHDIIAIAGALMASPARPPLRGLGRLGRPPRPSASTPPKPRDPRPDAAGPPGPERTENYRVSPDSRLRAVSSFWRRAAR